MVQNVFWSLAMAVASEVRIDFKTLGVTLGEAVFGRGNAPALEMTQQGLARGRGGHRGPLVDEGLVGQTLLVARRVEPGTVIVPIDTRMITDPARRSSGRHVGFSGEIMREFVNHAGFEAWLRSTMTAVARAIGDVVPTREPQTICVVLYCKSGTHRSVAASLIVQHILESTSNGVRPSGGIDHTCRVAWTRYCGGCSGCRNPSTERTMALTRARAIWRRMVAAE